MRVGFSGSRHGMTTAQYAAVEAWLIEHADEITEFHHGDCVGADEAAANLAVIHLTAIIHAHPATMSPTWDAKWRANTARRVRTDCLTTSRGSLTIGHQAVSPQVRNRAIVHATDILLACPSSMVSEIGGTWQTIKMGLSRVRSHDYRVIIINPETGRLLTW